MIHGKRDANQAVLTGYLEQCGWHVIDTADVAIRPSDEWEEETR